LPLGEEAKEVSHLNESQKEEILLERLVQVRKSLNDDTIKK
jgi:hypothetical protein